MSAGEAARPTRLGRYELITRIGAGGMAEVQLALQRGPAGFEKLVVVKLVNDSLASQKSFVDMLLDEARVAALVKHPNVVDIYDLGQADGRYFIAMEYLEGEPLLAVLRAGREGKRLDPLSMGRLIADTAEGLDAAHELRSMSGERLELVHHDISLGNIVVLYNGQVKLVDFGVAKATTVASGANKVQGKFSYMAPEKLKGAQGDRRSDLFSLGCVMWEALTLKRLFRGGNDAETMKQVLETHIVPPSKINPEVPPDFDRIVMRALDRDPAKRSATAKEMAVEIEEVLRKRGYGAKNDRIAKYMQDTFKGHIDARKKLVQEVVAKGSASAEILADAFSGPEIASGSPARASGDFSMGVAVPRATPTPVPKPIIPDSEISRPTEISSPPVMDESPRRAALPPPARTSSPTRPPPSPARPAPRPLPKRPDTATEIDAAAIPDEVGAEGSGATAVFVPKNDASGAEPFPDLAPAALPPALLDDVVGDDGPLAASRVATQPVRIDRRKIYIVGGAGAVFLIVLLVVVFRGGKKPAPSAPAPVAAVPIDAAIVEDTESVVIDRVGSADPRSGAEGRRGELIDAAVEPVVETPDAAVETPPVTPKHVERPPVERPPVPPAEKVDVEGTVNKALQSFVRGDARGALALLQKAKSAKPGYAPTYRVLGKVYKKLGDNANAKKAFQRYLQLAPTAADAAQIKDEIKKL